MGDEFLERLRAAVVQQGRFLLASKHTSSSYLRVKAALGMPQFLPSLAQKVEVDDDIDFVAGEGFGGVPLAAAVLMTKGINATYIRTEAKSHGLQRRLEGYGPRPGDIGFVVEDVITTGGSAERAVKAVRETGAMVAYVFCIVKRGTGAELSVPVRHLYTGKDFGLE